MEWDGLPEKAIIVGVQLPQEETNSLRDELDELESLLLTLGVETVGRTIQKRQKLTPSCFIGTGKVLEIKELAAAHQAKLVVFDRLLSPPQVRNLEQITGLRVLDRHGVILEIFSRHARSTQAKTQVEIARLEYLLPRLTGAWTHFQRQQGGVNSRGMGEKQIEIDRRRARERISRLQKQLEQIEKEKKEQRKARASELKVALVGYTNSGKTTLMKAMTKAKVDGRNALFATLDTNIKTLDPRTRPRILLSDTVGFIRNLPHGLIESFKSTLTEVLEADLLLIVVDVSYQKYEEHIETTRRVLEEIGAGDIPSLIVFNKADLLDDQFLPRILRRAYPGSITVSAGDPKGVTLLRDQVYEFFKANFVQATLRVPIGNQSAQSRIYNTCLILDSDFTQPGEAIFTIQTSRSNAARLAQMCLSG